MMNGLFIILVFFLAACRSVTTTEQGTAEIDRDIGVTNVATGQDSTTVSIQKELNLLRKTVSELNVEWTKNTYSPPDSTGKQHVTSTESAVVGNRTQTEESYNERITAELLEILRRIDSLAVLMEDKMVASYNTEEKEKPPWAILFAALAALISVYVLIKLIRK